VAEKGGAVIFNQSEEMRAWIKQTHGWFTYRNMDGALGLVTSRQKTLRRVVITRMLLAGLLQPHPERQGVYRYLTPLKEINWQGNEGI